MVRPWLGALGLAICGLLWLGTYAWSVRFEPPRVVSGLGDAAAALRFEALAVSLHVRAAEMHRAEVVRLRARGAAGPRLQEERFALADELRSAGMLADAQGEAASAAELLANAVRAAPERVDLRCLLADVRARELGPEQRRLALLRLLLEYDAACAHTLVGESFAEAGDTAAARAYLERATALEPDWARPWLALAELHLKTGDREQALDSARVALRCASGLRARLAAAKLVHRAEGEAPPRAQMIAAHIARSYWPAAALALAFAVFLVHPWLLRRLRGALRRADAQEKAADSAS